MRVEFLPLLLALLPLGNALAGTFEDRVAHVSSQLSSGEQRAALEGASQLTQEYPEDPTAGNLLAWVLFSQGSFSASRQAYERVLALSPSHPDARLGLAWCDARLGHLGLAREEFKEILKERPEDPSARQGLDLVGGAWSFRPGLFAVAQQLQGHPTRKSSLGGVILAESRLGDHLHLATLGRWLSSRSQEIGPGPGARGDHQEVWLVGSWRTPRWGLGLHAAQADLDLQGAPGFVTWNPQARVLGATFRLTRSFELAGTYSRSFYEDQDLDQLNLDAWIPIASRLGLRAGGELQAGQEPITASLLLGAWAHGPSWRVGLDGRLGPRRRPVDLGTWSVYNLESDRLLYGASVLAQLPLPADLELRAAYDLEGYETPGSDTSDPTRSLGHRLSLGLELDL